MEERIKAARLDVRNLEHQKKAASRSIGQLQQSLRQIHEEGSVGSAVRGALLRLRATETLGKLDKTFRQIESMQRSCHNDQPLPPGLVSAMRESIQKTILDHDSGERSLRKQLRESIAAYNDMLFFMRSRLTELRVPHSSIRAEPLMQLDASAPPAASAEESVAAMAASTEAKCTASHPIVAQAAASEAGMTNGLAVPAVAEGLAEAQKNEPLDNCSLPHGWTLAQPCAKGAGTIHLGSATLQHVPKGLLKYNGGS